MTLDEFSQKAVGVPFKEHGRDFDGWDCWGLVVNFYRLVYQVDLPDFVQDYERVTQFRKVAALFSDNIEPFYKEVEPFPGAIAGIYERGLMIHCGIYHSRRRILHVKSGIETCLQTDSIMRIKGFYAPRCLSKSV